MNLLHFTIQKQQQQKKKTCLQDYSMCDFVFTVIIPCCKMDSLNVLEIYINKIINNRVKLWMLHAFFEKNANNWCVWMFDTFTTWLKLLYTGLFLTFLHGGHIPFNTVKKSVLK